jgi:hypothetical protein
MPQESTPSPEPVPQEQEKLQRAAKHACDLCGEPALVHQFGCHFCRECAVNNISVTGG